MQLEFDGEAPKCPVCGDWLSGAIAWGGPPGDIWCEKGHYKGMSYSNLRRIGPITFIREKEWYEST